MRNFFWFYRSCWFKRCRKCSIHIWISCSIVEKWTKLTDSLVREEVSRVQVISKWRILSNNFSLITMSFWCFLWCLNIDTIVFFHWTLKSRVNIFLLACDFFCLLVILPNHLFQFLDSFVSIFCFTQIKFIRLNWHSNTFET